MEQDDRGSLGIWGALEEKDVAIGPQTADDGGAWRGIDGQAHGAGGDFAVVVHTDVGPQAPDIRPPRAGRDLAKN